MTSLPELYRPRTALDVPWDRARERRVLDRALASSRRRVRRVRVLELSGAVLVIVLLGRVLLGAAERSGDVDPAFAVPEAQLAPNPTREPAIAPPGGTAKRHKSATSSGFAGTGGHGGGGSTGLGGSAGTG